MGCQLVLLSGGYDSAVCAIRALRREVTRTDFVFFNYGQPYLDAEVDAVAYMEKTLGITVDRKVLSPIECQGGFFEDRNKMLVKTALKPDHTELWFGTRNVFPLFDKYGDSNYVWAKRLGKELDLTVHCPVAGAPKFLIRHWIRRGGLDPDQLFSSEGWKAP